MVCGDEHNWEVPVSKQRRETGREPVELLAVGGIVGERLGASTRDGDMNHVVQAAAATNANATSPLVGEPTQITGV